MFKNNSFYWFDLFLLMSLAFASRRNTDAKFYVYDWPGEKLGYIGNNWMQTNLDTYGYGKVVDKSHGLYHTNQYSLYKIMLYRALSDHRRTYDPEKAKLFFIPYDFGHDAAIRLDKGIWPNHCKRSNEIEKYLNESKYFQRSNGHDHVLIVSINFAMEYYYTEHCKKFITRICQNCIKLCIDDYSFLFGGILEKQNSFESLVRSKGINWRSMPFPSDVHWSSQLSRPYPWERNHTRKFLLAYGGSILSYDKFVEKLRTKLADQCKASPDICITGGYGTGRDFTALANHNGSLIYNLYNNSVFCINPPGDLPTRKGLFDSMLLGCIPVTFNPLTASAMYTWHWSEELWKSVAVEIDRNVYRSKNFNVVTYMQEYIKSNPNAITEKQSLLRKNAYRLQYSLVEPHISRPGPDAYGVAIESLLDKVTGVSSGLRKGSVPACGFKCN